MAESRGMDIIRSGDGSILIRAQLIDTADAKIVAGTASLRIWHIIPTTGALETYDFDDNTFKTGAITDPDTVLTHRQAENNTYDTGVWTYRHTSLGDFEVGDKYLFEISHASLAHPLAVEYQYGDLDGDEATLIPDFVWDENVTGHVTANSAGAALDALGTAIDGRANNPTLNALLGVPDVASTNLADAIWDEDIVAAHGAASSAGLLVRVVGGAISTRSFNATLNALLGVPDTAGTDTVTGQVWEEVAASHNTVGSMGEIMNDISSGGSPSASAIADAVWDEVLTSGHAVANSAAVMLTALNLTGRANNPTLNALLGVPDVSGSTIAETIWDENITTHTTASSAGKALDKLGTAIAARTNSNTLHALLGVADTAGHTIAEPIWDEVLDAAHVVADSAAQRLKALDDLTQAGGAGDLTDTNTQVQKIDQVAADDPAVAGSLAGLLQDSVAMIEVLDRDILISVNLEGSQLHIEVAVEQFGVIQTSPWVDAEAQIYDEANGLIHNIGLADFGAIGPRGFFAFDVNSHALVAGNTYQISVQITDGAMQSISTTKPFKIIQG